MHYGFLKEIFKIPGNYEQICFTPVGVPDPWPESPPKKPLDEFTVFDEFIENVNYRLPEKRRAITLEAAVLEDYAGTYELAPDFVITITTGKGRIYAQITGHPVIEIFPESETEFFFEFKKEETLIRFVKDEGGRVTGLVIVLKGVDNLARGAAPPAAMALRARESLEVGNIVCKRRTMCAPCDKSFRRSRNPFPKGFLVAEGKR